MLVALTTKVITTSWFYKKSLPGFLYKIHLLPLSTPCPDDGNNNCNISKTLLLHPTNLEGNAAPYPISQSSLLSVQQLTKEWRQQTMNPWKSTSCHNPPTTSLHLMQSLQQSNRWSTSGCPFHPNQLNCIFPWPLPWWPMCCLMMTMATTLMNTSCQVSPPHLTCKCRCCVQLKCCWSNSLKKLTCSLLPPLAPKKAQSLTHSLSSQTPWPWLQSARKLPLSCTTQPPQNHRSHLGLCTISPPLQQTCPCFTTN